MFGVIIAREMGIGSHTEAETDPLTLTISAPAHCEIAPATGWVRRIIPPQDKDGNWPPAGVELIGYGPVQETPVAWQVTGGTPPYSLTIDGETRDAAHTYEGREGIAAVSCALAFDESFLYDPTDPPVHRWYRDEPLVDSGTKTILASTTDATGSTAQAKATITTILHVPGSDSILEAGKTYRVYGTLITVPAGFDVRVGELVSRSCVGNNVCDDLQLYYIEGTRGRFSLRADTGQFVGQRRLDRPAAMNAQRAPDDIDRFLGELISMLNKFPAAIGSSE